MFLVEQNANNALQVADRGSVVETGRVVLAEPARICWLTNALKARTWAADRGHARGHTRRHGCAVGPARPRGQSR